MDWRISTTNKILRALLVLMAVFSAEVVRAGEGDRDIARVGNSLISEREISYKVQIEKAYGNEGATGEAALISLINDTIENEIATNYGIIITREEIDAFKNYVDQQTKAPEILQKVKLIFGQDRPSYERIYLAPKVMNWKLRDFYSRSSAIHNKERALIEKAYGLVVAGKEFQEVAQECGMEFSAFHIEEKGRSPHADLRMDTALNHTPAKDPLIPILDRLFPGEISRNIIEDDYRYRIIRLIERGTRGYAVETITIKKRPFDEWFRREAAKIDIEIIDRVMKKNIKTKYPDIWWVKKMF